MRTKWLGFSAILVGMSTSALMQMLVATSMPTMARDLGGIELYSWVFGGYMLASTITIPLFARLADIFGRRTLYVIGLSIFLAGSALIGTAQSMGFLVGYRVLQGIGAGAVAPAALASIGDLFGDDERGRMFGIIGAVQVLANLIGPPLGGWVTDTLSWRWGFYLVLPVGALALALAWFGLVNKSQWRGWQTLRLDWQSALIPIPVLKLPAMWKPVAGTLLLGMATNGAIAYFPLYLQKIHAQTATATGLSLLPMLLMAGIASGAGGSLASRYSRQTQSAAWILIILGFSLLAVFHTANIVLVAALIGAGLGLLLPVYLHAAQQAGGEVYLATASGLVQMARNLGGALGIPLLGAWLALGETNIVAFIAMFASLAFIGALGFSLGFVSPKPTHNTPHPVLVK